MVGSLGNSSNNFIGSYLNFYKINIISIVVRFPLGADPTLKKYLSWRMLEKT